MATFTLTPSEGITLDAYFFPNANGCELELTPIGEANNWNCVNDPREVPDADATYVFSAAPAIKHDLYGLPNHTTESGTINYVQVYARTKSNLYVHSENGIFKLILTENACANIYKSDSIGLVTSYNTYNAVWTVNPRTTNAWTWSDFDNLQIGIESSSPLVTTLADAIFRPNAVGDETLLFQYPASGDNYDKVDDVVSDGNDTYLWRRAPPWRRDTYHIPDSTQAGTINHVSIFINWSGDSDGDDSLGYSQTVLRINGTNYHGPQRNLPPWAGYRINSDTYNLNPDDDATWEWADIDNMQIGVNMYYNARCTQLYLVVNYNLLISPEVRTTQCYVKINYTTDVISCTLDKPEKISIDHDQNIKMLNFWSGRRAVYGLSRNGRDMVMTGILYSDTACTTIECIEMLGENGTTLNLSGLGSYNYDKAVKIASFGWKKVSDKPLTYRWILEMEFAK